MVKKDYSTLIAKIEAGGYDEQSLLGLYQNAQERGEDAVAEAVKLQLRERFTRTANRLLGAKHSDAQTTLEGLRTELSAEFDLSSNKVGSGVKAGGDMIAGRKYLDVYISYKNAAGAGCSLALIQDEAGSQLMAHLRTYQTGKNANESVQSWPAGEFDAATALYKERLRAITS